MLSTFSRLPCNMNLLAYIYVVQDLYRGDLEIIINQLILANELRYMYMLEKIRRRNYGRTVCICLKRFS